jgi:hypothetical protein
MFVGHNPPGRGGIVLKGGAGGTYAVHVCEGTLQGTLVIEGREGRWDCISYPEIWPGKPSLSQ